MPSLFVREHVRPEGWQVPEGNLLQVYLGACERRCSVANSGVASQLLRRSRMIQPLPYHRILGQSRRQQIATLMRHMDPSGSGEVAAPWARLAIELINPMMPWRESLDQGAPETFLIRSEAGADGPQREDDEPSHDARPCHALDPVPAPKFLRAVEVASQGLSDADMTQAVLEVLAVPGSGVSASDPPGLIRALFSHLDVSGEGYITSDELRRVALHLSPGSGRLDRLIHLVRESEATVLPAEGPRSSSSTDKEALSTFSENASEATPSADPPADPSADPSADPPADPAPTVGADEASGPAATPSLHPNLKLPGPALLLGLLLRRNHERVTEDECVLGLLELLRLSGLPLHKVESIVLELMSRRIRPKYSYDFSRCYLGSKGLIPLIEALHHDPSFGALGLKGTGVSDRNLPAIVELLQNHPSVTSLDLGDNPIGDRGGVEIARLLSLNPRLVHLDISGTHLMRNFSRVHHHKLGQSDCEDGRLVLQALQLNQSRIVKKPEELAQLLREGSHELRALFAAHADHTTGKVPLRRLLHEVQSLACQWGFPDGTAEKALVYERLLGAGARAEGEDGDLHITFTEFILFLDTEDPVHRVMYAIKHNRVEAKKAFFHLIEALPRTHQTPSSSQQRSPAEGEMIKAGEAREAAVGAPDEEAVEAVYAVHDAAADSVPPPPAADPVADPAAGANTEAMAVNPSDAPSDVSPESPTASVAAEEPRDSSIGCGVHPLGSSPRILASPQDGATEPTVRLDDVKEALIRLAVKPGSGWALSVQDMHEVLTPGTFGLMGEGGESSPRLSWRTFFNTALHILNR